MRNEKKNPNGNEDASRDCGEKSRGTWSLDCKMPIFIAYSPVNSHRYETSMICRSGSL